jgi:hypothetical protein
MVDAGENIPDSRGGIPIGFVALFVIRHYSAGFGVLFCIWRKWANSTELGGAGFGRQETIQYLTQPSACQILRKVVINRRYIGGRVLPCRPHFLHHFLIFFRQLETFQCLGHRCLEELAIYVRGPYGVWIRMWGFAIFEVVGNVAIEFVAPISYVRGKHLNFQR